MFVCTAVCLFADLNGNRVVVAVAAIPVAGV